MNNFKPEFHKEPELHNDKGSLEEYVNILKHANEILSFFLARGVSKSEAFSIVTILQSLLRDFWK